VSEPLHRRHYTLAQAQAARGWVAERVHRIRDARDRLRALGAQARRTLNALDARSGGAYPGREVAAPLVEMSRALAELQDVEIVLRDLDRGLVDFPTMIDGAEAYLCWLVDEEDEIAFWHRIDGGFAGRRAL